ncbi:MAG: hypothetical protein K2Y27_24575 [Xanthobacteraceae bacterium]|nr:hypothetical protein [Xanthobacteraceae bacterium]
MDRVALIAVLWFAAWIAGGAELAKVTLNAPLSGSIWGFVLALLTVFLWPWLMPRAVDDWMHNPPR